jgi:hypothetical protein
VLPSSVDTSEPNAEERNRFFATRTLGSLGATKPTDVKFYYHSWCVKFKLATKDVQALLDCIAAEGVAEKLSVDGLKTPYYCLAEDATRLEGLEEEWRYGGVRLINYFDSMLWHADRLNSLFGFERALEVYLKPEQRKYGYYSVPILYGDRIVGRLDPKVDRKEKKLIVRGLWYEEGFKPDEEYEDAFGKTLDDFAKFNGAEEIDWRLE